MTNPNNNINPNPNPNPNININFINFIFKLKNLTLSIIKFNIWTNILTIINEYI